MGPLSRGYGIHVCVYVAITICIIIDPCICSPTIIIFCCKLLCVHCIHVYACINFVDKLPTLSELMIFKYKNKGEMKKLQIIRSACYRWKDIASLICDEENFISVLDRKYRGDPEECLREVFIQYFINRKPRGYPQDWKGLIELLDDVDLERLAKDVEHALKSGGQHHEVSKYSLD